VKAVILAGGMGTRLSEETFAIPKPMIEIGGKPILWHIMKHYSVHGITDFLICCGYKGYIIKEYFANYAIHMSDVTFDLAKNHMKVHQNQAEPWTVTLVDTGESTMTGGRLKRIADYVKDASFCMTYGDGVSNVNIKELIQFHKKGNWSATVTAVRPPGRFGSLVLEGPKVAHFQEKVPGDGSWINGGFFVLEPQALKHIKDDQSIWEREPMATLAQGGKLGAYQHHDFWQPMDTLRDKNHLEELWKSGKAPWKVW
jgi:glucose-1-phosphate cytidylyltransferase